MPNQLNTQNIAPDSPTAGKIIRLSRKDIRIFIWRIIVFQIGLIPVSGNIVVTNSPGNFTMPTGRFFGYLFIANSVVTGLIDLLARTEKTRRFSRRVFKWTTIGLFVGLALFFLLPTVWK
jgi:hypothetical protein